MMSSFALMNNFLFSLYEKSVSKAYRVLLVPMALIPFWFQAHEVAKLKKEPETLGGKIASVIAPWWYVSFAVAKVTP